MTIHFRPVSAAGVLLAGALLGACSRDDAARSERRDATLSITASQRADIRVIGQDTLSDSARIVRLVPEPDGDAVAIIFADPSRPVTAGLALIDRARPTAQLLWPDSVTNVWWSAPHRVAFSTRTGKGVRAVVDVHKAALEVIELSDTAPRPGPVARNADALLRATAYIDSVHVQPTGRPQRSALKYSVDRIIPSPDGGLAAVYVIARDSSGSPMNPAWYVMDLPSGFMVGIDQITGAASELPPETGGWGSNGHFFFAKGRSVWESDITVRAR
jgi:hypothetical protein